jgi:hypothetical protein
LRTTVDKTLKKELDKKKHKDAITVLGKFEGVIQDEVKRLQEALSSLGKDEDEEEEDDEDDDKGVFKPEYLARMIKVLRGGKELQFCFGLNKQEPSESRLLLCKKREPERLFKMLKQSGEFTSRLLTYGRAIGDGKVLQFTLSDDAKEPSQILKLTKEYLKSNKDLKLKKLRVIAGGETFEEDMPDSEGAGSEQAAGVAGDLGKLLRGAAAANQSWTQARSSADDQIERLRQELSGFDEPEVQKIRERLSGVLSRLPDLGLSGLAAAKDQAAYDSILTKAHKGLTDCARSLQSDPAIAALDKNPFVKTNVVETLGSSLKTIARELKLV